MADKAFECSGGPKWSVEFALDVAFRLGCEGNVPGAWRDLQEAMAQAPSAWFAQRLPVLWTLYMASREADPRALTVWLREYADLLSDLPHDIVAHSIDEAIKVSRHGFIPSVGEVRAIADPLARERVLHIERLGRMVAALDDPVASEDRRARRADQRRAEEARR